MGGFYHPYMVIPVAGWKVRVVQVGGDVAVPTLELLEYAVEWCKRNKYKYETIDVLAREDNPPVLAHTGTVAAGIEYTARYTVARLHTFEPFRNQELVIRPKQPPTPPYPQVEGYEWRGNCGTCFNCTRDARYYRPSDGSRYCVRCYHLYFSTQINRAPLEGKPEWWRWAGRKWRLAETFAEKLAFAETYYQHYEIAPGLFAEEFPEFNGLGEEGPWTYAGVPVMPWLPDTVIMHDGVEDAGNPRVFSNVHVQDWNHDLRFAVGCVVCGQGGAISPHAPLVDTGRYFGNFHVLCWAWFVHSGAIAELGYRVWGCGHYSHSDYGLPEEDEEKPEVPDTCVICGEGMMVPNAIPSGMVTDTCPRCAQQPMMQAYHGPGPACKGCRARWTWSQQSGIQAATPLGVNLMFDLPSALADFYTLVELDMLLPEDKRVRSLFESRIPEIANQFKTYLVLACGGELRHYRARCNTHLTCVLANDYHNRPASLNDSTLYCRQRECWNCESDHSDDEWERCYHADVIEVRGSPDGLPYPSRPNVNGVIAFPLPDGHHIRNWSRGDQPVVVKGKEYRMLTVHSMGGSLGRQQVGKWLAQMAGTPERSYVWSPWKEIFAEHGIEAMEAARDLFYANRWRDGYGGYWWGLAADITCRYLKGELDDVLFIDHVFGMQHNGGSVLDKLYLISDLPKLLDLKRSCTSSSCLVPWQSNAVFNLLTEVCADLPGDEYQQAVKAGALARTLDRQVRHDTFNRAIREAKEEVTHEPQAKQEYPAFVGAGQEVK